MKLSLAVMLASVLFLSGSVWCGQPSYQEQNLPQQSSERYEANAPRGMIVNVGSEQRTNHETKDDKPPEIRVIVPPVTVTKSYFDYVVPLITLFFAGVLVCVGFMQWRTYEAQKTLLRQQTILAHRPHIKVVQVVLVGELQRDQPIRAAASLINIGSTDATLIGSNFTVAIAPGLNPPWRSIESDREVSDPYIPPFNYFESVLKSPLVEAGMQTLPVSQQRHLFLQHPEAQGLVSGASNVWAIGFVFYRDQVGSHHKTGFCRRLDRSTGRFFVINDPDLEYEY